MYRELEDDGILDGQVTQYYVLVTTFETKNPGCFCPLCHVSGKITTIIIPKHELRGFWGHFPYNHHHLGWLLGGLVAWNCPEKSYPKKSRIGSTLRIHLYVLRKGLSLHSYSFRMGLEPKRSSSIGKGLDFRARKSRIQFGLFEMDPPWGWMCERWATKKKRTYFPWNTEWLIGILISWFYEIIPKPLGHISSPTNTPTNQGPFFHCSGVLGSKLTLFPYKRGWSSTQ